MTDQWSEERIQLDHFLEERGWNKYICNECGVAFFSKQPGAHSCNWRKCGNWNMSRINLPKRKKAVSPRQIQAALSQQFTTIGYQTVQPRNIANTVGDTDLVVAGVQIFETAIHGGTALSVGKYTVAQPSIRMQFQGQVATHEGFSTSFVNTCTEEAGATFADHLLALDRWFSALSKVGLYMHHMTLIVRTSDDDWGTGTFSMLEIFLSYSGLEIGDATYMFVPPRARLELISISDIGFGLERLAWAVNRNDSYFDLLLPWQFQGERELADLCRTATLLSLCGVKPSNKGAGLQFRRLAKLLGSKYRETSWHDLLAYYFTYWSQFIEPSMSETEAAYTVRVETDRELNALIHQQLGVFPPRVETVEEYADRLAYDSPIDIRTLRDTIHLCRTT